MLRLRRRRPYDNAKLLILRNEIRQFIAIPDLACNILRPVPGTGAAAACQVLVNHASAAFSKRHSLTEKGST